MKKHAILGAILSLGIGFFIANNTNAISLDTSRLGINYKIGSADYTWTGDMLYGDTSGGTNGVNYINLSLSNTSYMRKYFFRTPSVTPTGNFASVHFETQIAVMGVSNTYLGYFPSGNLPYMNVITCNGSNGGFVNNEIIAKDVQTEVEYYDNNRTVVIRFYGNFTIRNIGQGSSGQLQCEIGSNEFAFFSTANTFSTQYINRVWFDSNPMTIEYSNNINDALLQQQVYQNNTIINQNQTIINQDQSDRNDLSNQQGSNEQQANTAGNQARNTGTTLYQAFTQLIAALTSVNGSSCVLPTMSVYSITLDNMDLCVFDIPPQIMALVSIGMVFIIVPLGINLVKRMINLYKEIIG